MFVFKFRVFILGEHVLGCMCDKGQKSFFPILSIYIFNKYTFISTVQWAFSLVAGTVPSMEEGVSSTFEFMS